MDSRPALERKGRRLDFDVHNLAVQAQHLLHHARDVLLLFVEDAHAFPHDFPVIRMQEIKQGPAEQLFRRSRAEQPHTGAVGKHDSPVLVDVDRIRGQFDQLAIAGLQLHHRALGMFASADIAGDDLDGRPAVELERGGGNFHLDHRTVHAQVGLFHYRRWPASFQLDANPLTNGFAQVRMGKV